MLWDDFLNSEWHDWRGSGRSEDRLDKPGWLEQWLKDHHLSVTRPPDPEDVQALKSLRSLLQRMVKGFAAGKAPSYADIEELNKTMADGPVIRRLVENDGSYRMEQTAVRRDWPQVMADIAASFAQTLAEGDSSRIRICENPDCLWVYYDDTRNRSKRYCDDKMCGNLMKVRRFRARKKASAEAAPKQEP
jgi:predicted RNA-binding Zn ribbon-like protein